MTPIETMVEALRVVVQASYDHPDVPYGIVFRNGVARVMMIGGRPDATDPVMAALLTVDPEAGITHLRLNDERASEEE